MSPINKSLLIKIISLFGENKKKLPSEQADKVGVKQA